MYKSAGQHDAAADKSGRVKVPMKMRREIRMFNLAEENCVSLCVDFVQEKLEQAGLDRKLRLKMMLLSEECAAMLREHSNGKGQLRVRIRKNFGDLAVDLFAHGEEFVPYEEAEETGVDAEAEATQEAIRSILLKAYGEQFKYSHRNGENSFRLLAGQSGKKTLRITMAALALGLLTGLILRLLPAVWGDFTSTYLLTPVKTMFMNALKIIIAPVVFFSIASCVSTFKNLAELGRIGAKVMGLYLITTLLAVLLSLGVFTLVSPGESGMALTGGLATQAVEVDTNVDTSLLSTIVKIVPDNLLTPFLRSDTLQLIFLGLITGLAVGTIGQFSNRLKDLLEALNSLFLNITMMITRFIPAAVFCSIALMLLQLDGSSILAVLGAGATEIGTIFLMLCIYALLILVLGRRNPVVFYKKIREGMLTSFTLCSSSAAMPTNMRICKEKLGIDPKVYSFSIPLGATVNMDGTCIILTTMGLFLARIYGISMSGSMLFSLMITIVLLSLGAPGVPGAAIVCLGIVLEQIGVPVEAISLVIPIMAFLDMFDTMNNTTGDMAVSTIVASREGLLDEEIYNKSR